MNADILPKQITLNTGIHGEIITLTSNPAIDNSTGIADNKWYLSKQLHELSSPAMMANGSVRYKDSVPLSNADLKHKVTYRWKSNASVSGELCLVSLNITHE